jgi:hypothetical protein
MNKNLEAYVKVYDNWISPDDCDKIVSELQHTKWEPSIYYDPVKESYMSTGTDLDICYDDITMKPMIMQRIWDSYRQYLEELHFPWFHSWQGFTDVRYNRYETGKQIVNHCDHIHSLFDGPRRGIPTMSAVGLLNDDYTGGEFFIFDDDLIPVKKGSIVIFPSCFLFPHRVEPILSGTRYSFVAWSW